ncbi:MAG: hypothetical protein NWS85_01810 [Hydrogenophaga sp.]|nr:hypothetical protein [Hydrogenophaga sp.]
MIEVYNPRFAQLAQGSGAPERGCIGVVLAHRKAMQQSDHGFMSKAITQLIFTPVAIEPRISGQNVSAMEG